MTEPLRVAIYARYSIDLQNPNSVRDQIASCRALARRKGWRVVGEYADEKISGSRSDRADFVRLQSDLPKSLFDLVLAESLDHVSRTKKDTASFFQVASFHDVGLHTVGEGEIGKMQMAITSTMAEMFLDNLRIENPPRREGAGGSWRIRRWTLLWLRAAKARGRRGGQGAAGHPACGGRGDPPHLPRVCERNIAPEDRSFSQ
ncbi:recombinase family protein [uncultured Paracoccus sp.]|uniref:recombinase family protein n=1 Tax=uncultured Paracoccus sp. TaxID=189685 RepID=UPI00262DD19E|nr:recombinase family protein [uncultured Paracoccus sp.]